MSDRCDMDIFENGQPLLLVDTGSAGGASIFEQWVKSRSSAIIKGEPACNAQQLGRVIDWHYSGGIAQVIVHNAANFDAVKAYLADWIAGNRLPLDPKGSEMCVLRWVAGDGLYRSNVTPTPEGAIAAFMDPISGDNVFI